MGDVGVAVVTTLHDVGLGGKMEGGVDQAGFSLGIIPPDLARKLARLVTIGIDRRLHAIDNPDSLVGFRASGSRRGSGQITAIGPLSHAGLPRSPASEFRGDRCFHVFRRHVVALDR